MSNNRFARIVEHQHTKDNNTWISSLTQVWVFGILKKQLNDLGVVIIRSRNFNGDWAFLMSVADGEKVQAVYPKPTYKDGIRQF